MALAALPARDPGSRARLAETARRARSVVLAHDRVVELAGPLGELLPEGLVRGSVTVVAGEPGAGATSVALSLCAAVTAVGEWAAAVDLAGTLGGEAAAEAGVILDRFAVARRVPPDRWATVTAVLVDGMSVVMVEVPPHARAADARRLVARARERDVVLVPVVGFPSAWPAEARQRVLVEGGAWPGLGVGDGLLAPRAPTIRVLSHGTRERVGVLAS
jgi:hypothetical protein